MARVSLRLRDHQNADQRDRGDALQEGPLGPDEDRLFRHAVADEHPFLGHQPAGFDA
jgi:hypothetical protein